MRFFLVLHHETDQGGKKSQDMKEEKLNNRYFADDHPSLLITQMCLVTVLVLGTTSHYYIYLSWHLLCETGLSEAFVLGAGYPQAHIFPD